MIRYSLAYLWIEVFKGSRYYFFLSLISFFFFLLLPPSIHPLFFLHSSFLLKLHPLSSPSSSYPSRPSTPPLTLFIPPPPLPLPPPPPQKLAPMVLSKKPNRSSAVHYTPNLSCPPPSSSYAHTHTHTHPHQVLCSNFSP